MKKADIRSYLWLGLSLNLHLPQFRWLKMDFGVLVGISKKWQPYGTPARGLMAPLQISSDPTSSPPSLALRRVPASMSQVRSTVRKANRSEALRKGRGAA